MKTVKNGIDRIDEYIHLFENKRIGLITNPTGINKNGVSTVDILHKIGCLECLFSPEHGVRGDTQAGGHIDNYTDKITGLPVYSLYGGRFNIPADVLARLDAVAFDIQDIGARYYTYMYTLSYAMEDCAAAGIPFIVLDRINPLGGAQAQGNILCSEFSSFVGRYPLATRHNFTMGEYAGYINSVFGIGCKLEVVPLEGWERNMLFPQCSLLWVPPSPNIPTFETALCYVGTCLFEGTNVSEGRGTTRPFECIGAPWLDGERVAREFNAGGHEGVIARGCYFTPTFSKYQGVSCGGVFLHITDHNSFRPFECGLYLLEIIRKTHPEFSFTPAWKEGEKSFIELLFGSDEILKNNFSASRYLGNQKPLLEEHMKTAREYYLYK